MQTGVDIRADRNQYQRADAKSPEVGEFVGRVLIAALRPAVQLGRRGVDRQVRRMKNL
jgi:hypothetical protein